MTYRNFDQLMQQVNTLRQQNDFKQGLELLKQYQTQFKDDLYENLFNQAYNAMVIPDHELAINVHQQIVENGFCTVINWDLFDPIRQDPRFIEVVEKSLQFKAKLQQQASLQCQVLTPDNHNPSSPAPLFIALHGDSNDTTAFKKHWQAQYMLAKGFVVVYVQSSQVICTNGFGWVPDYAITRNDISQAYEQVCNSHLIDQQQVIIGGFSGGSIAAIETVMANTIPVKGFISLCPSIQPASFNQQAVKNAANRGVKGVIMVGELDADISVEKGMMSVFDECGLDYYFHINQGVGHSYPDDLQAQLARAIEYIVG